MHRPAVACVRSSIPVSDSVPPDNSITCADVAAQGESCTTGHALPKWFIQNQRGWRRGIQNFTPSWFAVTMGTGIVSTILNEFSSIYPGYHSPLRILSIIFFVLNVFLFGLISFITLLRYTLYPATWFLMLLHPVQSLFLGAIPMGFATIVNMFTVHCAAEWGGASIKIAWAMWWIDAIVSIGCCAGLPFQMVTKHENRHETMTAAWLLPIVGTIVAAASGGVVASVLTNPQHALWTTITSYVLWGAGVPLALGVMVIYFHRLAIHSLPPREVIVSVFLPLGPLGQGGFSIMKLGQVALKTFPRTKTLHPLAGDMLYIIGFGIALVLWGAGLVWLFFAVASISRSKFPFNMGCWGSTFPLGVYAMSTITMGNELPSLFFKILGTVFGILVILLWFIVAVGTVKNIIRCTLFEAPCLREMEKARDIAVDDQ